MRVKTKDGKSLFIKVTEHETLRDGRPIIFILPGGPGFDHTLYEKHSLIFEELAHLVYFDPRSCGQSEICAPEECTLDNYIEDMEAIHQFLEVDKISLLGTSYGAIAAIGYGIRYADNVEKIVCVGGAPSFHFLKKAKENLAKRGTPQQIELCEKFFWPGDFRTEADILEFTKIVTPLYSVTVSKGLGEGEYNKYPCAIPVLNEAFKNNFWNFDYRKDLDKISAECYFLVGESDWSNDPEEIAEMASQVRDASYHKIADCGHTVALDQPEFYRDFLRNTFRAPSPHQRFA